jgi:integrase
LNLKEKDIDIKLEYFIIPHPKEKRPKLVPMIDEDIKILAAMPRGLPELLFFRHVKGISGVAGGQSFGNKYLYKIWKKACSNIGIEGIDLYGGTRHSSTTSLREYFTPEEIRNSGTLHTTNKAFDRYLQIQAGDAKKIYSKAAFFKRQKTDKKPCFKINTMD